MRLLFYFFQSLFFFILKTLTEARPCFSEFHKCCTVFPDVEATSVEAGSEGIYEEYDDEYAEYVSEGKRENLKDVNIDRNGAGELNMDGNKNGNGDKNGQDEGIYEQYDGDYE